MNKNHKFLRDITRLMEDAIREALSDEEKEATIEYPYNGGYIEITTDWRGNTEVMVVSDEEEKEERDYSNVIDAILVVVPEWNDVVEQVKRENEDEWQAHGFRDAADYWHWKEG